MKGERIRLIEEHLKEVLKTGEGFARQADKSETNAIQAMIYSGYLMGAKAAMVACDESINGNIDLRIKALSSYVASFKDDLNM